MPHAARASGFRLSTGTCPAGYFLPDTDRRIAKDRTGPDLDKRTFYIKYVTEPDDSFGKFNLIRSLAAAQPLTILSWPEALNVSGAKCACRMAKSSDACPLLIPHPARRVEELLPARWQALREAAALVEADQAD